MQLSQLKSQNNGIGSNDSVVVGEESLVPEACFQCCFRHGLSFHCTRRVHAGVSQAFWHSNNQSLYIQLDYLCKCDDKRDKYALQCCHFDGSRFVSSDATPVERQGSHTKKKLCLILC